MTSSDPIPLVLLPGLEGSGMFFKPFTGLAGKDWDCRVVSYPDAPAMDYDALEEWVLPKLPEKDYFLLAESFSGPLGVRLARQAGPRLKGLILAATYVRNPLHAWLSFPAQTALGMFGKVIPPDAVTEAVLLDARSVRLLDSVRRRLEQIPEDTFILRSREALGADRAADLEALKIPVLILSAAHDRLIHKAAVDEMESLAKRSTHVEIDAPHFLLQSAPAEAWKAIRDFAAKIASD